MNFRKFFDNKKIIFQVSGKPPQKSEWSGDNASLVIKFRKAALDARIKAGFNKCITSPVKLKMIVYAPTLHDRYFKQSGDDDDKKYIGDLDNLISGACDYLSRAKEEPGKNKFFPSELFDEEPDVGPTIPLIIKDDSQIKIISAEKIISAKSSYVVEIEII